MKFVILLNIIKISLYFFSSLSFKENFGKSLNWKKLKEIFNPIQESEIISNFYICLLEDELYRNILENFFNNLTDDTYFASFEMYKNSSFNNYRVNVSDEIGYETARYNDLCMYKWDYKNKNYNSCYYYTQYRNKILKLGYRPVVTLKIDAAKDTSKKEISSKLKIGDYVNYSAKNYSGWRVLSIDNEAGTVDIVSSGIVKNIQLYGIDDYENYEMILQNEVDSYKNGDNVYEGDFVQNKIKSYGCFAGPNVASSLLLS